LTAQTDLKIIGRQTHSQPQRLTDRWTDIQPDRRTAHQQTEIFTGRQTDRHIDRQAGTTTCGQIYRQAGRQTGRQTYRLTERQRDKETTRHTNGHAAMHTHSQEPADFYKLKIFVWLSAVVSLLQNSRSLMNLWAIVFGVYVLFQIAFVIWNIANYVNGYSPVQYYKTVSLNHDFANHLPSQSTNNQTRRFQAGRHTLVLIADV